MPICYLKTLVVFIVKLSTPFPVTSLEIQKLPSVFHTLHLIQSLLLGKWVTVFFVTPSNFNWRFSDTLFLL